MPKKSPYPDLWLPEISLSEYLFSCIKQYENDVALVDDYTGQTLTFDEVYTQARKCASALFQHGLRKGDIVAICAPSCVEYSVIILATAACGGIVTTCNPAYTEGEMLHQFNLSQPSVIFVHVKPENMVRKVSAELQWVKNIFVIGEETTGRTSSYETLVSQGSEAGFPESVCISAKEDLVIMPYSNGTTGLPKCVMHSHYSLVSALKVVGPRMHMFRISCLYSVRPMFHSWGIMALLYCLQGGVKLIIDRYFDVEKFLNAVQTYKVTHSIITPPTVIDLSHTKLHDKYDTSSLRFLVCGGSPVAAHLILMLEKHFNAILGQVYGMTEGILSMSDPVTRNPRSAGIIFSNTTIQIQDLQTGKELGPGEDGEILMQGPQVAFKSMTPCGTFICKMNNSEFSKIQSMLGYFKNPKATSPTIDEDGWLHTGDIGHYDKDGMLYVVGRQKEVINYKTFQIPPGELESLLLKHPKIADVGVIGILDPYFGELPRAFVVKKDDSLTGNLLKVNSPTTSISEEAYNSWIPFQNQFLVKNNRN